MNKLQEETQFDSCIPLKMNASLYSTDIIADICKETSQIQLWELIESTKNIRQVLNEIRDFENFPIKNGQGLYETQVIVSFKEKFDDIMNGNFLKKFESK